MQGDPVQLTEDGAVRPTPASVHAADDARRGRDGLGFVETLRALKRRRWTIVATTALGVLAAYLIVDRLPPQYRATATVMLDLRESKVVDFEDVLSGLPAGDDTINSEILVARSPLLVAEAARTMNLAADPEFNAALDDAQGGLKAMLGLADAAPSGSMTPEAALYAEHAQVVAAVLERLTVARVGRSRAIDIRFVAAQPEVAAGFVNALADAYLVDQLNAKRQATASAQAFLDSRVAELRNKVQAAERAIEANRIDAGLIGTEAGTIAAQQLSGLSAHLVLARTQRAEAEARLRQVRRLTGAGAGSAESAAEVLGSPVVVSLRAAETDAQRKIAELSEEYGDRHPQMIAARARLRDVQSSIRDEIAKIVASLENEAAVARAREAALADNVASLERTAADQGAAEVQIRALEREADAARALFAQFLTRASETATQTDTQRPDARILARAAVPTEPAFPKPAVILPIAGLLSLCLGLALALLREQFDHGYRSGDRLERDLGVPTLALVPAVSRRKRKGAAPERYVLDKPASAYAEALRSIHTGLRLAGGEAPAKSVLITSVAPKEGKSTLALALGRLAARSGRAALLVDADLRRPRAATALGLADRPGLADILTGAARIEDAIQRDDASGLFVLAAGGQVDASPPDLLGSARMHDLLTTLEGAYDLVIVDAPPALAVSDSRALARHVDSVIVVVRWGETRREAARTAIRRLRDAGGRIAGVVLTMVDVGRLAQYGYGEAAAYSAASRQYFQD